MYFWPDNKATSKSWLDEDRKTVYKVPPLSITQKKHHLSRKKAVPLTCMFLQCSQALPYKESTDVQLWSSHLGSVPEAWHVQLELRQSWRWWQLHRWDQSSRQSEVFSVELLTSAKIPIGKYQWSYRKTTHSITWITAAQSCFKTLWMLLIKYFLPSLPGCPQAVYLQLDHVQLYTNLFSFLGSKYSS